MWSQSDWLPDGIVAIVATGRANTFLGLDPKQKTPWYRAACAYASNDPLAAAEIYGEVGAQPEEAYARLRAAELLVQDGRRAEADAELERALAFWRTAGATAFIRQGEALMAESA
jgi:predicted Zn-dependent protease